MSQIPADLLEFMETLRVPQGVNPAEMLTKYDELMNGNPPPVGAVSPCCPAATQQRRNAELHPCTEAGSGRTRQGQEKPRQSAGKVTRGTSTGFLCPTAVLRRGLRSLGLGSNLV